MTQHKNPEYESNPFIDRLPPHLKQFIKPQNYEEYTPINQATWRYVMRKNVSHLSRVAHETYVEGLRKTGVNIEDIPSMYGMNRILKEIGWAAVAVDGFIPPNAFMEFQAYKVLVIASDIRQLEHIEYTPAPDIIHESAGHAPIIANPDYAEYLRRLGEIGANAITSKYDTDIYEAVRRLSILKEAEDATQAEIDEAEKEVIRLQDKDEPLSEMAQMRNLQWWSVEYGLVGTLEDYKIYGAGLLSSIGESEWCLKDEVKKVPYNIDTAQVTFDITKPQPQLFVTPNFGYLMQVLEQFANTLALRTGGWRGIQKLINSDLVGSIELNTGLQVSGVFSDMKVDEDRNVVYFKTKGPTALAYREKELIGHGTEMHHDGFGSPLGKLKGINLAIENMSPRDLDAYGINEGERVRIEFESGVIVEGDCITGIRSAQGVLQVISFENCTVTYGDEILFRPEWGVYDMAVGTNIVSAFAGSADYHSFPNLYHESETKTHKEKKDDKKVELESFYAEVRAIRESGNIDDARLLEIYNKVEKDHAEQWLIVLEILEITNDADLKNRTRTFLENKRKAHPHLHKLITDGLMLLEYNF